MSGSRSISIISLLSVALIAGFTVPTYTHATVACPKGTSRPATAEDIKNLKATTGRDMPIGTEYCPDDAITGADVAEAKRYLRSIVCRDSNWGGAGPDGTVYGVNGHGGLDVKFSQCAAQFLKAASAQLRGAMPLVNGGTNPVCLREGYRTLDKQKEYFREYQRGGGIACGKNGFERCEHPRGIAIDVNTVASNYPLLHRLGAQMGVSFYLPINDKVHFVPGKTDCSSGGSVVGPGNPTYYDFPDEYRQSNPGAGGLSEQVKKALGIQPQQPPASAPFSSPLPAATTPPPTVQPQICTPEFSCYGNTMYYRTTSCTTQVYQSCPRGCNGNSCLNATTTQPVASSTIDLLNAFNKDSTSDATLVSDIINLKLSDFTTIGRDPATSSGTVIGTFAGTPLIPLSAQQTFITPDLNSNLDRSNPQSNAFQALLGSMKTVLLKMLDYIKGVRGA